MGLSEKAKQKYWKRIAEFLLEDEAVIEIYGLMADFACLTNKRVIFIDKSAGSGSSITRTIPFSSIVEIGLDYGVFLSNNMEIITAGKAHQLKFNSDEDVAGFYRYLSAQICNLNSRKLITMKGDLRQERDRYPFAFPGARQRAVVDPELRSIR
jgi:hypothetical protein